MCNTKKLLFSEKNGITLIALVVTIVVLLILAGITINLLFSNGGIFNIANQSKIEFEIGSLKDRINNVIADWSIERLTKPGITVDNLWDKMVDADIINNPETDVDGPEKIGENDSYDITTNEGYVVEIIVSPDGNVTIGDVAKEDKLPPKIGEVISSKTDNSIHVDVTVYRLGNGTLSYYYKKETDLEDQYLELKKDTSDLTADFINLEKNTVYDIKITAKNSNGTTEKVIKELTMLDSATEGLQEGSIIASNPTWNNESASITLSKGPNVAENLIIQYQINKFDEKNWTTGKQVTGLHHNDTVYARLVDDSNSNVGNFGSIIILDNFDPLSATIDLSSNSTIINSAITATITHNDKESGVNIANCKWIYNTNSNSLGTNANNYLNTFTSNNEKISLTTSTQGTYYLHILTVDKANRAIETISEPITVSLPNSTPTISSVTLNNKTTNSIIINANAIDADNDNLTYKLYTSTSETTGFTEKATSAATTSGTQVTLTATGLTQYTDYYYYVTVTDGKDSIQGATTSVKTYCPTTYCNGKSTVLTTCSSCQGTGKAMCYGQLTGEGFSASYWDEDSTYPCSFCGTMVGPTKKVTGGDFTCKSCGWSDYIAGMCTTCRNAAYDGVSYPHRSTRVTCSTCGGTGKSYANGCSHSKTSPHYYCIHGNDFTSSVHD